MKAVLCTGYGDSSVIQIDEHYPEPELKPNQVKIQNRASSVNSGDVRIRKADPWMVKLALGFTKPRQPILGVCFSGEVVAVGAKVTRFKPGDEVFGTKGMQLGAHASVVHVPEDGIIALKSKLLTHEQAASIPFGATTALHFLRLGAIQPGQRVLIYGASGAVGTAAVQLARFMGAHVTAVARVENHPKLLALGAHVVLDYRTDNIHKQEPFDCVFESVNKLPVPKALQLVKKGGSLLLIAGLMKEMAQAVWYSIWSGKSVKTGLVKESSEDLEFLNSLVENQRFQPVLAQVFSYQNAAEAHDLVDTQHKYGNVVIQF